MYSLASESQMSESEPTPPRIYLDYNASSPLAPGVAEAVMAALALPGNPSSPHAEGRSARKLLEKSRLQIADLISADPLDLIFCSGGSEANHLGLIGLAKTRPLGKRVFLSPTLHPSLAAAGRSLAGSGYSLETLAVDSRGRVQREALQIELAKGDVCLVAFGLANHETGAIEDAASLAEMAREAESLVFCDAVQALGRIPLNVEVLGVDGLAISAHKIGGPKGVGALWLRPGPDVRPLVGGGKQEAGRRPGTQASSLIAGFAAAGLQVGARLADAGRQSKLRNDAEEALSAMGAQLLSGEGGLCNTVCARFPGVAGDLIVSSLDLQGVAISTGAACSSGTTAASSNLLGMGLSEAQALEAFRVSMGPATSNSDVEVLLELLPSIIERARRFS